MRLTQSADRAPRKCAVSGRSTGPLVDFDIDFQAPSPNTPNFLYLHGSVVQEAARRFFDMVPRAEVDALNERLDALTAQIAEMQQDMDTYAEFEERFKDRSPATREEQPA